MDIPQSDQSRRPQPALHRPGLPERYQQFVLQILQHHQEALQTALKLIAAAENVETLEIELASGAWAERTPLVLRYRQTLNDGAISYELHPLDTLTQEMSREDACARQEFNRAGVEIGEIELQTMLSWLIAAWQQICPAPARFPAWLYIHNDIERYDLNRQIWQERFRDGSTGFLPDQRIAPQ